MIRNASYPSLEARVAFVTGGGSGIGASIVEHLCAQRARVAFVDIERAASHALVETIQARGQRLKRKLLPEDVARRWSSTPTTAAPARARATWSTAGGC
jgi:NAD(P)-dependent dehydrogenase (short-subunit alcohol dehydrogenase family)